MSDLSRLSKCYASAIHDVLREMNFGNCVLPPEIQALERGQKLIINIKLLSLVSPQQILGAAPGGWSQVLSKRIQG